MKWVARIGLTFCLVVIGLWVYKANISPQEVKFPVRVVVDSWIVIAGFIFFVVYYWCLNWFLKEFFFKEIWFFVVLIFFSICITAMELNFDQQFYFNFFNIQYIHIASLVGLSGLLVVGAHILGAIWSYREFKKTGVPDGFMAGLIKFIESEGQEPKVF